MPMSPIDRKVRLIQRGVTLAQIQASLEGDKPTLSHIAYVVRGERGSKRVQRAIAKLMGVSVSQAFG